MALCARKYKYNAKKLQHWVENEWTGVDATETKQGTRQEATAETQGRTLDPSAVENISDLDEKMSDEEPEDGHEGKSRRCADEDI